MSDRGHDAAPTAAWVFSRPDRILAFGLGSGLLRPAPGTWGTAMGWLLWELFLARLSDGWVGLVLVLAFVLGCFVCQRCGRALGRSEEHTSELQSLIRISYAVF